MFGDGGLPLSSLVSLVLLSFSHFPLSGVGIGVPVLVGFVLSRPRPRRVGSGSAAVVGYDKNSAVL